MFKCPVCNLQLIKMDSCYVCEKRHSYDISSKGYVNLLLANQKHSINPGDSKEMILSRVNFLKLDHYSFLREKILETILKYLQIDSFNFCDLACGEGYYTNYVHEELNKVKNVNTIGVDISKYAIIEACKKKKEMKLDNIDYCIGNLMNLPFLDETFSCMLNCFALFDENEFKRVLKKDGYFIRVLPDARHLYELKEILYENVILNEMKEKEVDGFTLVDEIHINNKFLLKSTEEIYNLFTMTPYYYKSSKESLNKLAKLQQLEISAEFVLLVYQKV